MTHEAFLCPDGQKLGADKVCDGVADCGLGETFPGGEDEEDCESSGDFPVPTPA